MSPDRLQPTFPGLLALPVLALLLGGCIGGGSSNSSDSDDEAGLPAVSFVNTQLLVGVGQSTTVNATLDEPAPTNISVPLRVLELPKGSFEVSPSVIIPGGASEGLFSVRATGSAQPGDRVEIEFAMGAGYRVGTLSSLVVRVPDEPLPLMSLVGGNLTVTPGEAFFYSVQRTECRDSVAVPLVVLGLPECFIVPRSVTLVAGLCSQSFTGRVDSQCASGSMGLWILPPEGYANPDAIILESARTGPHPAGSDPVAGAPATVTIR